MSAYLRIRPTAPETFTVPEQVKVSGLDDDAPSTARQPELAHAWARRMNDYPDFVHIFAVVFGSRRNEPL
jgi:hypothetical protein